METNFSTMVTKTVKMTDKAIEKHKEDERTWILQMIDNWNDMIRELHMYDRDIEPYTLSESEAEDMSDRYEQECEAKYETEKSEY